MIRTVRAAVVFAALVQSLLVVSIASACTGITIKPRDGSIIVGRTLEFATDLKSNILVIPRSQAYVGSTPTGQPGKHWKMKFAAVGVNAFDMPVTLDGLNETGLAVRLFYFPGFADYQAVKAEDMYETLAPWELGVFLLGSCSDASEAVAAARGVHVADVVQKDMGFVPAVHYIVTDAQGHCVVLEYIDGRLKVHSNPLGVLTNSPSFDWHLTNLSNYVNLGVGNIPQIELAGQAFKSLGQGSGLLGLPGDFTPPSRFVRAVVFSSSALPVDTAREGVLQTFHILNQFDIPKGAARGTEQGKTVADYTLWTSAADVTNLRYYYRTFANSRIHMVDLKAVNLDARGIKTISMQGDEQIEDVSKPAR